MESRRLRPGEIVAVAGAVALLPVMLLDWYEYGSGSDALGQNAWEALKYTDVFLALVALLAVLLAGLTATQRSPALPVAASVITTVLGALATLLLLYRIVNQPGPNDIVQVQPWAWLGLLCVVAITAGGWLAMRDETMLQAPIEVETRPPPPTGADPLPPVESQPPPAPGAPRSEPPPSHG